MTDEELYEIVSKNYAEQNAEYLQQQMEEANRRINELERSAKS